MGENVASLYATVSVRRFGGTNQPATVSFATANGSATAGADYLATNGVLTFLPGETVKTFNVRILNDTIVEQNETVVLNLSNPNGSNVLSIATGTLLILEDDIAFGQFVFASSTYTVAENGTNAVLTILRTNGYTGVASVRYRTVDNTASGGLDYSPTNNTLAFADGETAKTIEVAIIDDLLVEASETLGVILSNPTGGATLGSLSNATVNNFTGEYHFNSSAPIGTLQGRAPHFWALP